MTENDQYAGFAHRYDLFYESFAYQDPAISEFFCRLFADHRARRVLDCACGTGHELALFHGLGLETVGSDLSAAMLARAKDNLTAHGVPVPLYQIDYRDLPQRFGREFDAVVCLSTSIAHMLDEQNVLLALRSMRAVLRDGGLLVLTQGCSDRQWREKPRFLLAADTPAYTRLFVIDYLGERSARYQILDVLREAGRPTLETWTTEYTCLLLRDDQERLLRAAGFTAVDFYGSFDFTPYDKESSQRLIAVAQR